MPKELWALSPERMELREYEMPAPREGEVLVRSEYATAKHGTEIALVKGYAFARGSYDVEHQLFLRPPEPSKPQPVRVGNMFVGRVIAAGPGVKTLSAGDRVLAYGAFREVHVVHEDRCWPIPEELSWKSAVCLDPADFALGAVRDGNVRVGDAVAVFGMGAIGLLAVQIAKLAGASPVIAVEPLANRRQAAEACGADIVFDPTQGDVGLEIKKATGRRGVDVAIEYSGSMLALQAAFRCVAFGGNVVAGAYPPPYGPGLDLGAEAHLNIPNLIFSRACSEPNRDHPRWNERRILATCLRLLIEGKLSGEHVVTPVVPFPDLVTEYPKIISDPGANIKIGTIF